MGILSNTRKRRRTNAVMKAASMMEAKQSAEYIQGIHDTDKEMKDVKRHCRCVSLLAVLFLLVQAELFLPHFRGVYELATMPFYAEIVYGVVDFFNRFWLALLFLFVALEMYIRLKTPPFWEKFLLKAPLFGNLMAPLYAYRYLHTLAFLQCNGGGEESLGIAKEVAGNEECFTEDDNGKLQLISSLDREYPFLGFGISILQDGRVPSKYELDETARYAHGLFIDATFDFKESFAGICVAALVMASMMMGLVMFDAM